MDYSQENRRLIIRTPLGDDVLRIERFEGQEDFSSLFKYELSLVSTNGNVEPNDIVGKRVSFAIELPNEESWRWFDGFVRQFSYLGKDDRQHYYAAEVVPWFWFATQTSDCRIFQDKTILEIVRVVLAEHSTDFEIVGIAGKHGKLENCVQYRETDFEFISRLLEREGLFYYFRHEEGKHTLVISDSKRAYVDCLEGEIAFASNLQAPDPSDQITSWEHRYEFRSGKTTATDYNFKTPSTSLLSTTNTIIKLDDNKEYELFDYPGNFQQKDEGTTAIKLRIEEQEIAFDLVIGKGKCRSFGPGVRFTLSQHHNPAEQGKSYVVTGVQHRANLGGSYDPGHISNEVMYSNVFTCIPDSIAYRPAQVTPRRFIRGLQTAVVVGKPDEIQVDNFGRIRVQFHWDRYGKNAHDASCWMRVVQPIAGDKWGFQFIPRVGQEVVVQFLEGDPDRPICTGSVYHAELMPPYDLPAKKTQSGIKTHSTVGGGASNFNEIRFEDKKGGEELHVQAEKDKSVLVKHNNDETIGNNESLSVGVNRTKSIGNDETTSVGHDRTETVGANETIVIGINRTETVGANETTTIGANETVSIGASQTLNVGAVQTISVGAASMETIGLAKVLSVGAGYAISVGAAMNTAVGGISIEEVGKTKTVIVSDEFKLQVGDAELVMKKDGTITLTGKSITLKGSKGVVVKGQKIELN